MNMKICLLNLLVFSVFTLAAQGKVGNFTDLEIDGPVIIELVQGSTPGVVVKKSEDLVSWEVNGNALVIMARYQKNRDTPELEVTIPDLQSLETTGAVILNGNTLFATRKMTLTIGAQSIVSLEIDTEMLVARVKAQSILNIKGNADDLDLSVNNQSIVNAENLHSAVINLSANHQSVVTINTNGAKVNKAVSNQSVVVD